MNLDFDPALFVPVAVTAIGAPPIKQPAQKHAPFRQPAQIPETGIAHAKPAIGGRKSRKLIALAAAMITVSTMSCIVAPLDRFLRCRFIALNLGEIA